MDRELWLLEISGATLGVVLLLVVFAILHRRHVSRRLNQISDQLAEGAVDNGETLKGVVKFENDATRRHVSHAVDAIAHNTEMTKLRLTDFTEQQTRDASEFRGQLTVQKSRLQWLIGVVDALSKEAKTFIVQARQWFDRKSPPP
jgi:hypothetical protein